MREQLTRRIKTVDKFGNSIDEIRTKETFADKEYKERRRRAVTEFMHTVAFFKHLLANAEKEE